MGPKRDFKEGKMNQEATMNDKVEDAKSNIAAQYVGRSMARGNAEQVNNAFRLFNIQAQRIKAIEKLKKMVPGD